ncbi:adenylyl-sulfate kinase [bacterium]|nr:adenylyl-sulfate kinase [bacterium]NDA09336.1 adenylyl-sulfate kinase [Verrucomicrobiota bacterium]
MGGAAAGAAGEPRTRIVVVGHVDHGKSTLIGRLLADTDSLPEGKLEAVEKACREEGMPFEHAFLLDALLEEQAQNITIDTTRIEFRHGGRAFQIIDAPGHREFIKNMVTGAAAADEAILMIDAKEGLKEQTRRHGLLLSLLGVAKVIVAVNKMDLVDWKEGRFRELEKEIREYLGGLKISPREVIPISAREGSQVKNPDAKRLGWFRGPTLLQALLAGAPGGGRAGDVAGPLRFVVQDVYRFDDRRVIAGRIESGTLKVGDSVVFFPDRKTTRIKTIEDWGNPDPVRELGPGRAVAVTLEEQIFVERGHVGAHEDLPPVESREVRARIFWLDAEALRLQAPVQLRLATQNVEARLVAIDRVVDAEKLEQKSGAREEVGRFEVAEVRIRCRRPLVYDAHDRVEPLGRFALQQGPRLGGGGIVLEAEYPARLAKAVTGEHLTWTEGRVSQEARAAHFGHEGAVIWLTGLSGSGKSTLAVALESLLFRRGIASMILDGDNLRHGLCADLGFSLEDRAENIRRAGEMAKLMAESGLVVISSLISPLRKERQAVRSACHAAGVNYSEVFVNAPLGECEKRDPRGLYRKARAGEIKGFTGIDSPYEEPERPDLVLRTDRENVESSVGQLLRHVLGLVRLKDEDRESAEGPGGQI